MTKTKTMMTPARKEPDASTYAGRFAIRLKQLREKTKMTPQELAEKLGVTATTIYSWESTHRSPHITDFQRLAEALNLKKVKDLFPNE